MLLIAPKMKKQTGRQAIEKQKTRERAMVLYFTGTGNSRYLARYRFEALKKKQDA